MQCLKLHLITASPHDHASTLCIGLSNQKQSCCISVPKMAKGNTCPNCSAFFFVLIQCAHCHHGHVGGVCHMIGTSCLFQSSFKAFLKVFMCIFECAHLLMCIRALRNRTCILACVNVGTKERKITKV